METYLGILVEEVAPGQLFRRGSVCTVVYSRQGPYSFIEEAVAVHLWMLALNSCVEVGLEKLSRGDRVCTVVYRKQGPYSFTEEAVPLRLYKGGRFCTDT